MPARVEPLKPPPGWPPPQVAPVHVSWWLKFLLLVDPVLQPPERAEQSHQFDAWYATYGKASHRAMLDALNARPPFEPWANQEHNAVARLVAECLRSEKLLNRTPYLHPQDSFALLDWAGINDVWFIQILSNRLEHDLRIKVAVDELDAFSRDGVTLLHVVDACAMRR